MRQQLLFLSLFGGVLALPLVVAPAQEPRSLGPGPGPGRSGTMLAEIDRLVEGMMAFDADKNGRVTRAELTDNRLLGLFDRADIDKDGTVSKPEFLALAERNFVRCDLDKDGRITVAECRQALRRKPVEPANAAR